MTEPFELLTESQRAALADERTLLADLRAALERHGAPPADVATIDHSIRQLDDLFLLVVVGEFNAGKSAFVNVLVRHDVLEEGVTPTTSRITVLRFGPVTGRPVLDADGIALVAAPAPLLELLHIVDTPGTNAVLREHEAVTERFVPRADLVVFLTSADRPFTESERAFLERIRDWGKKVVVVVNKVDILERPEEVDQVVRFVAEQSRRLLGLDPALFAVSARAARRALGSGDAAAWSASGFERLERHLEETLDETERVRLKLLNPLGVAERATRRLAGDVQARGEVLGGDVRALENIDEQLKAYGERTTRDFAFRMADIEKLFVEMERRGHDHFDETIRLPRVMELLDRSRMERRFAQEVVADTPQRVERKVNELVDWLIEGDIRQWQAVNDVLAERRLTHQERLPAAGSAAGFHQDRARLLEFVGREAQRIVDTYDRAEEASVLAEKARNAVAASAAIEVGAAGLGAAVAAVATTAAADFTGFAMAGVLATVGLLVIPNRRRQAKRELREKVTALRQQLTRSLRQAFEDELANGVTRVRQGVEPYARFVEAERERLDRAGRDLGTLAKRLAEMRERIGQLP